MYLHRYLCDVFDEMRKCNKTRNYGSLMGLIEEAQSMGNRMEAALNTYKDDRGDIDNCRKLLKQRKKLLKEIKELEEKRENLTEE